MSNKHLPLVFLALSTVTLSNPAFTQSLPSVSSGSLVLHLKADPATLSLDSNNNVLSWTADNDPSIVFTPSATTQAGEIVYSDSSLSGQPTLVVTDISNPSLDAILPAGVSLTDATIFWLGSYDMTAGGGQYVYTVGTQSGPGATMLTHQEDGGDIEIFNGSTTFSGVDIDALRGIPTIWTTQYFSGTPIVSHIAYADGSPLSVTSNTVGYDVSPDPHPISLFSFQGSSFNFEGRFSEMIVYDGLLSAADIAAVEAYLSEVRGDQGNEIDLSQGEVVQYDFGCQGDAQWVLGPAGRSLDQLNNADASIYLTDVESSSTLIKGRLSAGSAPDFMGFVFGYQDRGSYYLFDWKKVSASFCGGTATQGMRLRKVQVPNGGDPEGDEMWGSGSNITVLADNAIPWVTNVNYEFELFMEDGQIEIQIRDGQTILESWVINDSTYTSGRFGLFINSLQDVAFGPITAETAALNIPFVPANLLLMLGVLLLTLGALRLRHAEKQ